MSISTSIPPKIAALALKKPMRKQEHLSHSTGNILFITATIFVIFLHVWMTRGIRNYRDVTTCCFLAIGMTPLTVLYFILGNGMINGGLGVNKDAGTCAAISTILMTAYFTLKMYTGFFFFKKLREIVHIVTKGSIRTRKHDSAKGSFYYVFIPLFLAFLLCAIFSVMGIETFLKMRDIPRPGKPTYCVLAVSHAYVVVTLYAVIVATTSATFGFAFLYSSTIFARNTPRHPGSPVAGISALLSAVIPFMSSIYFLSRNGNESASLVELACSVDAAAMHVLVWVAEGQWGVGNTGAKMQVCKCFRLPSQILGGRATEELRARVMEVRELHRTMEAEEHMLLSLDQGEDEASPEAMNPSVENRYDTAYGNCSHPMKYPRW